MDKSVIHTEDDKYMIYEIEELAQEDHKVCFPFRRQVKYNGALPILERAQQFFTIRNYLNYVIKSIATQW